ncbi:hypothetical protein ABNF97_09480 [Plantactinospora sp. B6F1]|uniref:hypothetical protein n=1 Tax=Plantactinospora sp. B6F1 TaxID=3158971 RepID=UPI0032D8DC0A
MNIWQRLLAWRRVRRAARELINRRDDDRYTLPGYRAAMRFLQSGDVKDFVQEKPHERWRRIGGWW